MRKRFRAPAAKLEAIEDRPLGLVVLATPKFAGWLEDDSFISGILEGISRTMKGRSTTSIDIDVVCACVDGLTPDIEHLQTVDASSAPSEGLSFIQGLPDDLLPGLWNEESSSVEHTDLMSTLTFSGRDFDTNITVPLANTLFITGSRSTLLVSRWRSRHFSTEKGATLLTKLKTFRKTNQVINVFDNMDSKDPMTCIPAVPLTPARKIASGLGNIVRRLEFGPKDIRPASRELEASVNNHVKSFGGNDVQRPNVSVWALVVPKNAESSTEFNKNYSMRSRSDNAHRGKILGSPNSALLDYIGYWIKRGATFCRVCKIPAMYTR
jgi:hypothetical protein